MSGAVKSCYEFILFVFFSMFSLNHGRNVFGGVVERAVFYTLH